MDYLVYDIELIRDNGYLERIETGLPKDLELAMQAVDKMNIGKIDEYTSTNLFTNSVSELPNGGFYAEIFKTDDQQKALHILEKSDGDIDIKELLPEEENVFTKGSAGIAKIDGKLIGMVEHGFGSYFCEATSDLKFETRFSSDPYEIVKQSSSIGKTKIRFNKDAEIFSVLFREPSETHLQEDFGLGGNSLESYVNAGIDFINLSETHEIIIEVNKDDLIEHRDVIQEFADSDLVERIRVENTQDGVVTITNEDEATRETVEVRGGGNMTDKKMLVKAFEKFKQ